MPFNLDSVEVSNLSFSLENQQTPWFLRLPRGVLSVKNNDATGEHPVLYEIRQQGMASWSNRELAIDRFQLKATYHNNRLKLDSLQLVSAGSELHLGGGFNDLTAPRLDLSGQLNLDCQQLSNWANLQQPVSGYLHADLSVVGLLEKFKANVEVSSKELSSLDLRGGSVAANLNYDQEARVVELKSLAAELLSGTLGASGRIALDGPKNLSQVSAEFGGLELAQALSAVGLKNTGLSGKGSARINASWPGLEWRKANISAVSQLRGTRGHEAESIALSSNAQLSERNVRLKVGSLSMSGAGLEGNLDVDLASNALTGRFQGRSESLARLAKGIENWLGKPEGSLLPPVDGAAQWTASVSGTLKRPLVSIQTQATSLSEGEFKDATLDLRANVARERLELEEGVLRWEDQQATGSGEVTFGPTESLLHFRAHLDQISVPRVLKGFDIGAPVAGSFSVQIDANGTTANPVVNLKLNAADLEAYGEQLGVLSAEAVWKNQEIVLDHLRLDKPQTEGPGLLEAHGSLDRRSREYEFQANGDNLKASSLQVAGISWLGTLQFHSQGRGSLDNPSLQLEAAVANLVVSNKPIGEVKGKLQVAHRKVSLDWLAPALEATGKAEVRLESGYPAQFQITAVHSPLSLTKGGARVASGSFDLKVTGEGPLTRPELLEASAQLDHLNLSLGQQEVHNPQPIELHYAGQRLDVNSLDLTSGESRVHVAGNLPVKQDLPPGKISIEGHINLDSIAPLLVPSKGMTLQGIADLNAEITGSFEKSQVGGLLQLREGRLQSEWVRAPLETVNATVRLRDGLISVEESNGKFDGGTVSATGVLPLTMLFSRFLSQATPVSAPAHFSIQANQIGLSSLVSLPEGATGRFSADIQGEARKLAFDAVKARLRFGEIYLQQGKFELQQAEPTILTLSDAQLRVERWQWKGAQTQLNVEGTADLAGDQKLDLQASGKADASLAALFIPTLQVNGIMQVNLKAGGTLQEPSFSGSVDLDQGRVGMRSPQILAEDLKVRVELAGRRIEIKSLTGKLNGGGLQGGGGLTWEHGKLQDVTLELRGRNIFLDYPKGLKTASAIRIDVKSREDAIILGGQLNITEGSYHDPFELTGEWRDALKSSDQGASVTQGATWRSKILYDLKIQTRQPVDVDNNLAKLSASADLRLSGSWQRPGLVGSIDLEQGGKLYFGDRVYYVERGVVTFANESRIDPVFDILATTKVGDYEIALQLSGTTKETKTTFTSDPPLSQNDVISVLLTGKTLAESGGSSRDLTQLGAFSLASGAFNAGLSGKARRVLGISQISIDPGLIGSEANPGARLTIGQDLTRSLRLVYSMNLTNSNDQIWILQYDFTRRFTGKAVQQSDNTYRVQFTRELRFGGQAAQMSGTPQAKGIAGKVGTIRFSGHPLFDEAQLASQFKIKPGATYEFAKVRKGIERLEKFYREKGYLESRVRLGRKEQQGKVNLNVGIEAGKKVKLVYEGASLSGGTKKRVRQLWQEGVADSYRSDDGVEAIRTDLAKKGYLQSKVTPQISELGNDEKTVVFEVQPGIRYRGVKIVFQGVTRQHETEITQMLSRRNLTETLYANPSRALDAIGRYYLEQGYLLAKVGTPRFDLDAERKTGQLILSVEEGSVFHISALRFDGNKNLADAQLRMGLPMNEGSLFNPIQMDRMVAAIEEKYGRNGFRDPQISYALKSDEPKAEVAITFTVVENLRSVVESVSVEGEDKTSDAYVRKQLSLRQGQPYDASQVNDSIGNLYRTGAFSRVDVQAKPIEDAQAKSEGKESVSVVVKVQEPEPFKFVYGGLYDSDRGPGFTADLENRNSLGSARVLGLRTRYNRTLQEGRMYFSQPTWQRSRLQTTATLFLEWGNVQGSRNLLQLRLYAAAGTTVSQKVSALLRLSLRAGSPDRNPGPLAGLPIGRLGDDGASHRFNYARRS